MGFVARAASPRPPPSLGDALAHVDLAGGEQRPGRNVCRRQHGLRYGDLHPHMSVAEDPSSIQLVGQTNRRRLNPESRSILNRFDVPFALSFLPKQLAPNGEDRMSKKAAEHHKKASEHLTHAARHHGEAAKHHDAGHHEKAAHHAHTARGHATHARGHADEAAKAHTEEHGKK